MPSLEIWEWGLKIFCGAASSSILIYGTTCKEMYGERYILIRMWHQMQGNVWGEIYTHTYVAPDAGNCMERDIHSYVCGTRCRELYGERYTLIRMWHQMQGIVWREIYTHMYVAPDVGKCMERDIHSYVCGTRCREMYGEIYTHMYVAPHAGKCMERDIHSYVCGTRCREMYGERYTLICMWHQMQGIVWREIYTHMYVAPDVGKCMERYTLICMWHQM